MQFAVATWSNQPAAHRAPALRKLRAVTRPAVLLRGVRRFARSVGSGVRLRRLEALRLTAADLDFAGGAVSVRQGKGRKDRVIPIGERALAWLGKYLTEARPKLAKPDDEAGPLFVTERGTPFTTKHLSALVTERLKRPNMGSGK